MTNCGVELKASDDFFHLCLDDTITEKQDRYSGNLRKPAVGFRSPRIHTSVY